MSTLFTAFPYLLPSSFLFLSCIPLGMPSLGFISVLARLSQQTPWKLQPRMGRGRGTRLSLCPRGGRSVGLQGPLVATGSRGGPRGQPCIPRSWRAPASWELPAAILEQGGGSYLQHPRAPQLPLFCRKEKGNQGHFFPRAG